MANIAINGLGRIGRAALKILEVPLPYAKPLEVAALPDAAAITRVVRETVRGR